MSYIRNNRCDYVYVNKRKQYECLITCLRKSKSVIGLEFLTFFTFNFFMKACIQENNLLPDCVFG